LRARAHRTELAIERGLHVVAYEYLGPGQAFELVAQRIAV
jgi:hypothetical protein